MDIEKFVPKAMKKSYRKNKKNVHTFLLLAVSVIVYMFVFKKGLFSPSAPATQSGEVKRVMYGVDSCGWTVKQKKELGDKMKQVEYVNCKENPDLCKEKGVKGYPTWEIDGKMSSGYKPASEIFQ